MTIYTKPSYSDPNGANCNPDDVWEMFSTKLSGKSTPPPLDTGDATPPMTERNDHSIPVTCENNSFLCLIDDVVDPTADVIYTTLQLSVNIHLDVHNTADNTAY